MEQPITPEYVRSLTDYTDNFLCEVSDNIYNLKFLRFRVRDMETGYVLFEVCDDDDKSEVEGQDGNEAGQSESSRTIRYHLGPDFLDLRNIGTSLTFSVGNLPLKNLQMIERHYFKGQLIKSFDFKFDFCIPNSVNTWETIYIIPELPEDLKEQMINEPWETKSDSFYFVGDKLIMHHKALYNYSLLE